MVGVIMHLKSIEHSKLSKKFVAKLVRDVKICRGLTRCQKWSSYSGLAIYRAVFFSCRLNGINRE